MKDLFERVYCINLKHRVDRWERFIGDFSKYYGIEEQVERLDGIVNESNQFGCFLAHYNAIKKALTCNLNSVLIFEDDVMYVEDEKYSNINNLKSSLSELKDIEWDVLFLGHNCNRKRIEYNVVSENLLSINKSYGAHAYVLSRTGICKLNKYMDLIIEGNERRRAIDKIINWQWSQKETMHCFCPTNFFITQDSFGGSNINKGNNFLMENDILLERFIKYSKGDNCANKID